MQWVDLRELGLASYRPTGIGARYIEFDPSVGLGWVTLSVGALVALTGVLSALGVRQVWPIVPGGGAAVLVIAAAASLWPGYVVVDVSTIGADSRGALAHESTIGRGLVVLLISGVMTVVAGFPRVVGSAVPLDRASAGRMFLSAVMGGVVTGLLSVAAVSWWFA